jgi:hypothetical protein
MFSCQDKVALVAAVVHRDPAHEHRSVAADRIGGGEDMQPAPRVDRGDAAPSLGASRAEGGLPNRPARSSMHVEVALR